MVVALFDEPCPACGGTHTLHLTDHAQAWANREFTYTCPDTGQAAVLRTAAWDLICAAPPVGGVPVSPAGG